MANETVAPGQSVVPEDAGHPSGQVQPNDAAKLARGNIQIVIVFLSALVILGVDLLIPLGVADSVLYVSVVLFSLRHEQRRFTVMTAVLCLVLTILGFFFSPPGGELLKVLTNRTLALFAIWVTAILTLQRKALEEKRDLAIREIMRSISPPLYFLMRQTHCSSERDEPWRGLDPQRA